MLVLFRVKKILLKHFMELRWHSITLAIFFYILMSWVLLWLSGEKELTAGSDFVYWIMVTASTVGYGDLSPVTTSGKYIVGLFVIPCGLGLFGLAIGRLAAFISFQWRKGVQGLKSLNYENHILVIGWNDGRTLQLIRLLLREMASNTDDQKLALCVRADIENPMPDEIGFVKVVSFSSDQDMARAAVENASCIIIDNPDDDVTMTTALYCSSKNPNAHTIAYFQDEKLGNLLKQHCPNIECMPSVAVEMIAKSAVDPGSSVLHHELLDVEHGMTQYSIKYDGLSAVTVRSLFSVFKEKYEATLIGISNEGYDSIQLNPALDLAVNPGGTLYYIADERIKSIHWEALGV
ncbi:MAG: potassium channel protein [Amphritea sp.]|nr:potassium channel protein [Amphritea sp.]MBQ0783647.1 potassium channel protein [Amphritea sp.]